MSGASSFQRITRDIMDLCELQIQLLSVDSQAAKRNLTFAIGLAAASIAIGGSALTVLFAGFGFLIAESTALSTGGALLVVGVAAALLVTTLLVIAKRAITTAAEAMNETKSEFAENLRWLKATLVSPNSSPRNQMRSDSFPGHKQPSPTRFQTDFQRS